MKPEHAATKTFISYAIFSVAAPSRNALGKLTGTDMITNYLRLDV